MRAGELNKLIDIQQVSHVSDNMGGTTDTWSAYASSIWAAIWPISAKEQVMSAREEMEITHRVKIRYLSGLTAKMRIKYGTRYFDITSIINTEERGKEMILLAREVE